MCLLMRALQVSLVRVVSHCPLSLNAGSAPCRVATAVPVSPQLPSSEPPHPHRSPGGHLPAPTVHPGLAMCGRAGSAGLDCAPEAGSCLPHLNLSTHAGRVEAFPCQLVPLAAAAFHSADQDEVLNQPRSPRENLGSR